MAYELVAFDLDGTLLVEKSSWWKLHRFFGSYDLSLKNMRNYEKNAITYDEFMRRDIALWKPPPHVSTIERILLDYLLVANAKYVIDELRQRTYTVMIITTGLDILADDVASNLGIPHSLANGLIIDKNGYLTGEVVFRVDLFKKHEAFNKFIRKLRISRGKCVAVGDSKYDIGFLKNAALGVAFKPDKELRNSAKVVISDLKELLDFI